jgi:DNA polymerase III epsilon subunit-like protein
MRELLFLDTETGGLDPADNSLLTIGLVCWKDGEVVDAAEVAVKHDVYRVTAGALGVNKINLVEHDAKAVPTSEALAWTGHFIGKNFEVAPVVAVGHNVSFDMNFILQLAPRAVIETMISHRRLDTAGILRYLHCAGVLEKDVSSFAAALEYFGLRAAVEHSALTDALDTAALFNKLLELCPEAAGKKL